MLRYRDFALFKGGISPRKRPARRLRQRESVLLTESRFIFGGTRMGHIELESARYVHKVMKEEQAMQTRARNAKAIEDFTFFCIGVAAFLTTVWAVQAKDSWLPLVRELLHHLS